jgi:TPR repeat protein
MKLTHYITLALCLLSFTNRAESASPQAPRNVKLSDFVKLAEEGMEEAQYLIGRSVLLDEEVLGEKYTDKAQALKWLDEAVKTNPINGWFVGSDFEHQGDPVKAQLYYQKSANAGYKKVFSDLAYLYLGQEHSKAGNLLAKRYFEAAASYGNFYALVRIGHIYQNGWGVEQDFIKAREYFQKAIDLGETAGYTALGEMKEKDLPNPDYKEILNLYLKDAQQGSGTATIAIKRLYLEHNEHLGLTPEVVLFWHYVDKYNAVINYGHPPLYLNQKTKIETELSKDQISEIKKRAETLFKSFSSKK